MLKLFYSPGACSMVTHIALEESGAEFEPVRVTLAQAEHLKPEYLDINPHARVPALATGHGVVTSACGMKMIREFIDAGSADGIDLSCVQSLRRPAFFLLPAGPDPGVVAGKTP